MNKRLVVVLAPIVLGCGSPAPAPSAPAPPTRHDTTPAPENIGPPATVSADELETALLRLQYAVPKCIDADRGEEKTLEVSVTINPQGAVGETHVSGRYLEGEEIQCMERRIGEISFPPSDSTWILQPELATRPPEREAVRCDHPDDDPVTDILEKLEDDNWMAEEQERAATAIRSCDVNREMESLTLSIRADERGRPTTVERSSRDDDYWMFRCAAEKACRFRFHPTAENSRVYYPIRMQGPESPATVRNREIDAAYEQLLAFSGTRAERLAAWQGFVSDVLKCGQDENVDFEDEQGCSYLHRDDAETYIAHLTEKPGKDRKANQKFRAAEKRRPKKVVIRGDSHGELEVAGEQAEQILKQSMRQYKEVQQIGSPEWSVAAGYRIGQLYELFVDAINNVEPPPVEPGAETATLPDNRKVPVEEYEKLFRREISRGVESMRKLVVKQYRETRQLARVLGVENKWTKKIEQRLEALTEPAEHSEK